MDLMSHPAFKNVDPAFLNILQKNISSLAYKSDAEAIGVLMSISNEARKHNVTLTPDMQIALLQYLKSRLPVSKRTQFDAMIKLFSSYNRS